MAERLRIALISERFGHRFGGAESYATHLFEILSRQYEVTVIAREFDHALPVQEVRVKGMKGWPGWIKALHFAWQAKRLTRTGYDVVHTHAMGPAGDVHVVHVVPVRFRRIVHQARWQILLRCLQPRNIAYLWLESASVRTLPGRHVVAVSPSVKEQLQAAYPELHALEVIPPGAHEVPMDADVRARLRGELGWDEADMGCLLVARNPLRKGLAATLNAFAQLPAHYKLAVIGADADARQHLRSLHQTLATRVTLIDPVTSVSPYYQAADIYVHPTLLDSFGMAPLEAMAHGLPVVLSASQYCGFAAFVHDRQDAWVLQDPKDPRQIAEALFALGTDPALRMSLVTQSAALVRAHSWPSVAQRYESLYEDIDRHKRQHSYQRYSQPRMP